MTPPIVSVRNEEEFQGICAEVEAAAQQVGEGARFYWQFHRKRFIATTRQVEGLVESLKPSPSSTIRLLDIGNSIQTVFFAKMFENATIDTLGYFDHAYPISDSSHHYEFDLNDTVETNNWIQPIGGKYDIIAFFEVLEHLYTSPVTILGMLREFLADDGFLVLQTPNFAALRKRMMLWKGINPCEHIRLTRGSPGHFREYTISELEEYASKTGFEVSDARIENLYAHEDRFASKWQRVAEWLPDTFKETITLTLKKR